jgi:hypothetical protein
MPEDMKPNAPFPNAHTYKYLEHRLACWLDNSRGSSCWARLITLVYREVRELRKQRRLVDALYLADELDSLLNQTDHREKFYPIFDEDIEAALSGVRADDEIPF